METISNVKDATIYVGTYKKYNEGSLFGKWLKLSDYADKDEFYKACRELHKDEREPELMFQDYEFIPKGMCGESWVSEKVWDLMNLDDDDIEIIEHYCDACSIKVEDYEDIEDLKDEARDKFVGYYDSVEDLGREEFEMFLLPNIDKHLQGVIENYFDCEDYGRSIAQDYYESEGYYFDTNR